MNEKLGGLQRRSGRFGEKVNLGTTPEYEPLFIQPVA
jgi:hypothetical protein